jgi:hypothetical protein
VAPLIGQGQGLDRPASAGGGTQQGGGAIFILAAMLYGALHEGHSPRAMPTLREQLGHTQWVARTTSTGGSRVPWHPRVSAQNLKCQAMGCRHSGHRQHFELAPSGAGGALELSAAGGGGAPASSSGGLRSRRGRALRAPLGGANRGAWSRDEGGGGPSRKSRPRSLGVLCLRAWVGPGFGGWGRPEILGGGGSP